MTTYKEAIAEARQLVKRSEEDQWRLAELTWEQVEAGKSRRQWARDIGVDQNMTNRWYIMWERWGASRGMRPTATDAYVMVREGVDDPTQARRKAEDVRAIGTIRDLPPERKAQVARELLADEDVADAALNTPEVRTPGSTAAKAAGNVARATEARRQEEARRTERETAGDSVSQRMQRHSVALDLSELCDRFARDGVELLQRAGDLPESEKTWLAGSADRAGATLAAIRDYIDTGRTGVDAELAKLLEGGM